MKIVVCGVLLAVCATIATGAAATAPGLSQPELPSTFCIEGFADAVPNAREFALGASGSKKSGYRVMSVQFDGDRVVEHAPLVEGFVREEAVSGRPGDVLVLPDGALLVADDHAVAVYRMTYAAAAASNSQR